METKPYNRAKITTVCTTNEAREYFKQKGLTYDDITEGDILILSMFLEKELKKSNKIRETSATMSLSRKVDMKATAPSSAASSI